MQTHAQSPTIGYWTATIYHNSLLARINTGSEPWRTEVGLERPATCTFLARWQQAAATNRLVRRTRQCHLWRVWGRQAGRQPRCGVGTAVLTRLVLSQRARNNECYTALDPNRPWSRLPCRVQGTRTREWSMSYRQRSLGDGRGYRHCDSQDHPGSARWKIH